MADAETRCNGREGDLLAQQLQWQQLPPLNCLMLPAQRWKALQLPAETIHHLEITQPASTHTFAAESTTNLGTDSRKSDSSQNLQPELTVDSQDLASVRNDYLECGWCDPSDFVGNSVPVVVRAMSRVPYLFPILYYWRQRRWRGRRRKWD